MSKTISLLEPPKPGVFSDRVSPFPFVGLVVLYLITVVCEHMGSGCISQEEQKAYGIVTYVMLVLAFFLWLWIQFYFLSSRGTFSSEIIFGIWTQFVLTVVYMVDVHRPFLRSDIHSVAESAFHVVLHVLVVLMMGAAIQFAYRAKRNLLFG